MNSIQNPNSPITSIQVMMIMLIAGFCVAVSSQQAVAQTIVNFSDISVVEETEDWVQSLEKAVELSSNSGKPIMFVFSGSDWCSYCQLLDQEVLQTPDFELWSRENVIKVMVDFPKYNSQSAEIAQQNQQLEEYFMEHVKGYPTVLLVQSDGAVIGRSGYVAGGPGAWIAKTDSILRQSQPHVAETIIPSR